MILVKLKFNWGFDRNSMVYGELPKETNISNELSLKDDHKDANPVKSSTFQHTGQLFLLNLLIENKFLLRAVCSKHILYSLLVFDNELTDCISRNVRI